MSKAKRKRPDKIDQLAQKIALDLFTAGGESVLCHRVELREKDGASPGGWSLFGAQQQIAKVLREERA